MIKKTFHNCLPSLKETTEENEKFWVEWPSSATHQKLAKKQGIGMMGQFSIIGKAKANFSSPEHTDTSTCLFINNMEKG